MAVIRYVYMHLDPTSPLADTPLGGAMVNAAWDHGKAEVRGLLEKLGPDDFRAKWAGHDPNTLTEEMYIRTEVMTPLWTLLDLLEESGQEGMTLLRTDIMEALEKSMWQAYTEAMDTVVGDYWGKDPE